MWLYILIAVIMLVVLIVLYVISTKNKLFDAEQKIKNSWSQIEVILQQRGEMIPNIVATVKGYAKHEAETLEKTMAARAGAYTSKNPVEAFQANQEITQALGRLMAVAESYPELKANTNFLSLQQTLENQENKILKYRQFYNDVVLRYNRLVGMFPSSIVAGIFNYKEKSYLEAAEGSTAVPKVEF